MPLIINPSSLFRARLNQLGYPWNECLELGDWFNGQLAMCGSLDLDDGTTYDLSWRTAKNKYRYNSIGLSRAKSGDLIKYVGPGGIQVEIGEIFLVIGFCDDEAVIARVPEDMVDNTTYLRDLSDNLMSDLDVPPSAYNFFEVIRRAATSKPTTKETVQ